MLRSDKKLLLSLKRAGKILISFDELGKEKKEFDNIIYSLIRPTEYYKNFYRRV